MRCDVCQERVTWYGGIDSDEDYLDRVKELLNPPEIEFEGAHPKNAEVEVHVMEGKIDGKDLPPWLFITHADLTRVGYKYLEDFDVVRVNGDYYELQGYLENVGTWWVEPIDVTDLDAPEASET